MYGGMCRKLNEPISKINKKKWINKHERDRNNDYKYSTNMRDYRLWLFSYFPKLDD